MISQKNDRVVMAMGIFLLAVFSMSLMNVTAKSLNNLHHPGELVFYRNGVALLFLGKNTDMGSYHRGFCYCKQ